MLSMVVALTYQSGIFGGYYLTPFLISLFWLVVGILSYVKSRSESDVRSFLKLSKLFLLPWVIFIVYNFFIFTYGIAYQPFMKSSYIQILFAPIIILGAIGSYITFRKDTLRYFIYAIVLSYIITLFALLFKMGPDNFFAGISSVFVGNSVANPFEQNSDLVLALGLLLFYYFDPFIRKRSNEFIHPIMIILLVFLGGKRIELLAVAVLIITNLLLHILPENRRNKLQFIVSALLQLVMFTFVFITISGFLSQYVYSHGINTMGRIKMWDYVAQYTQFSPSYLGRGYSFSNLLLEENKVLTYQGTTYVLHSDVLKIFFDLGFAMFAFWSTYFLYILPKKIRKLFGFEVSNLVWTMIIYLFILYFTDNAINYFVNQTLFVILVFQTVTLNKEYNNKIIENKV